MLDSASAVEIGGSNELLKYDQMILAATLHDMNGKLSLKMLKNRLGGKTTPVRIDWQAQPVCSEG